MAKTSECSKRVGVLPQQIKLKRVKCYKHACGYRSTLISALWELTRHMGSDSCTICCRPEVDNDVISGMTVDNVGMDVHVKFGDSRSNGFRDIRGADFVSNEHCRSLSQ